MSLSSSFQPHSDLTLSFLFSPRPTPVFLIFLFAFVCLFAQLFACLLAVFQTGFLILRTLVALELI